MSTSNFLKMLCLLALAGCLSCRFWQPAETVSDTPVIAGEINTGIPFSVEEPPVFQAEIVVRAADSEKVYFTARNGQNHLTVFNRGEKNEIALVRRDGGDSLVIDHKNKTYRTGGAAANGPADLDSVSLEFVTTRWLVEKKEASFENLGTENNLVKYRVRFDESAEAEVFIYFDTALQIPVRQEFFSTPAGQRKLMYTVEVRNFQTEAPDQLFAVPENYRELRPGEQAK